MVIRITLAVLLASAAVSAAGEDSRMRVLIKPGAMSETAGKGNVEISMSISEVHFPAGAACCRFPR